MRQGDKNPLFEFRREVYNRVMKKPIVRIAALSGALLVASGAMLVMPGSTSSMANTLYPQNARPTPTGTMMRKTVVRTYPARKYRRRVRHHRRHHRHHR